MKYFVNRDGKEYGPYSLAELRTYLQQNRMLATDPVRSEEGQQWGSIADLLAATDAAPAAAFPPPPPPPPPQSAGSGASSPYAPPSTAWQSLERAPSAGGDYPDPPHLSWVVVLALGCVTCFIYMIITMFQQASWARKIDPANQSGLFYAIYLVCAVLGAVLGGDDPGAISRLLSLAGLICFLVGAFQLRATIEKRFGVARSGVMTFFFSTFYFQYHLERLYKAKHGIA